MAISGLYPYIRHRLNITWYSAISMGIGLRSETARYFLRYFSHPQITFSPNRIGVKSHAVIGNQSSGLKSRPGNCSFTPVVLRSSAWVIVCCKFREGKTTGRNVSESVLASLTNWGCWPSYLKGKTDTAWLTMSVSGRSSGVIRVACSGRHVVQDGRSNRVVGNTNGFI